MLCSEKQFNPIPREPEQMGQIRLFIADDHAAFSEKLANVLKQIKGVEIIGQAENASQAIDSIRQGKPEVVILDIHMPPRLGGFEVLRTIKERQPSLVVIMLTAFPSEEYKHRSISMGADYFFDKSRDLKNMLSVIKTLAVGRKNKALSA
jgi:DNA-binding NarL/FixJ family response regulator